MRKFTGIDFMTEAVPDETTLCKFRHLLEEKAVENEAEEERKTHVRTR